MNVDFLPTSPSTLSFPEGTLQGNTVCSELVTLQDKDVEGDHSFHISLVNATEGTTTGPLESVLVTIIDDGMSKRRSNLTQ